ncbi:LacI family DNA-binding transcriptional regulator [Salinibacterium soli]|uniref:LacI family DNA-binding transcriptional regulator n=1 Tax=Antiquaquibacter soli TaxID=3064523 RepID=A0ABT9BP41_9MICO|nr:LacI family DNA-binding transcriptional regulator [Protaetiibacter sp. WY-16]MDO7881561.1 LacI family DNA-binding transcriptional regulator [Protaetiibacter sp. WY-16]
MEEPRAVTIHDVATRAGVAVSSVSRALSSHPDVSPAMKAKVFAAAEELGYTPDPGAQSLRSGFTRTIGFVVRDFANPFFGDIIHGVEEALNDAGYTLLVTNSSGDPGREVDRLTLLRQRKVDALLLSSISEASTRTSKAVAGFTRPVVLIDRDPRKLKAGSVLLDHAQGVRDATADLIALGHRRIAMITGSTAIRPTRERLRGYTEAFEAAGIPIDEALQAPGAFSAAFARETTERLLALPPAERPTAIVAGGVQTTIGVLEAFSELGLRPGDDVSLVVCDDLPWLRVMRPRLSVVTRDAEEMGRQAAGLALELIKGGEPRSVTLPTAYEVRETSRPVSV